MRPASEARCRLIRERNAAFVERQPGLARLRERLLRKAGREVVLREEPQLELLLSRGSHRRVLDVRRVKGDVSDCHGNSARYWLGSPDRRRIAVGFALSGDLLWRQHSWVEERGALVETTEPRTAYFGAVLKPVEMAGFAPSNLPELGAFLDFLHRNNWFRASR